ncbi:hypothetical protein [Labrenzia sp. 011]|uniref:hypothetical protein n=1 Tax=Labrenzia sp. 011 TaxID=2171494 RepID=UPI000D50D079|nr:hypothetical protein [Labrenzia sp. 011]PVB62248.1 hypothetical protein DCO57_08070 [Labrenzia sp. 011]
MRFELLRGCILLAALCAGAGVPAYAEKGDLKFQVPKSAPLLQGRTLDLRFAKFAQGIWVSDLDYCPAESIDRSAPGTTLAIYRGLLETPGRICQVYGAEQSDGRTQRAAINCLLSDGGEAIELVTVQPRGTDVLMVQEGERPPVPFRFCQKIIPILKTPTN